MTTISLSYGFTDSFRVMADYQSTGWSSLQDVTIKRANGTVVGSEDFSWKDTDFVSVGVEYDLSEAFTLRAGVGQDESALGTALQAASGVFLGMLQQQLSGSVPVDVVRFNGAQSADSAGSSTEPVATPSAWARPATTGG